MSQFLLASNTSAVYVKTQTALGTFENPTYDDDGTTAIRVVGTPKWSVRGASLIQRTDTLTPYGGGQAVVTGGLGWDISFQTEFFWNFAEASDITIPRALSQLSALWLASPWNLSVASFGGPPAIGDNLVFGVQPIFFADTFRSSNGGSPPVVNPQYTVQPFSLVYEELGGKRFEAYDCVCIPKISWEYGQRIMIDWTIKGKWLPVTNSINLAPVYISSGDQPPLIGQAATLTMSTLLNNANALSKVTVDTGWTINDVQDSREAHSFGLGFISLTNYPTVEIELAEYNEATQPDWGYAQANTINGSPFNVSIAVGSNTLAFDLVNPQLISFPAPTDTNGYRATGLKFGGIPTNTNPTVATMSLSYLYP